MADSIPKTARLRREDADDSRGNCKTSCGRIGDAPLPMCIWMRPDQCTMAGRHLRCRRGRDRTRPSRCTKVGRHLRCRRSARFPPSRHRPVGGTLPPARASASRTACGRGMPGASAAASETPPYPLCRGRGASPMRPQGLLQLPLLSFAR